MARRGAEVVAAALRAARVVKAALAVRVGHQGRKRASKMTRVRRLDVHREVRAGVKVEVGQNQSLGGHLHVAKTMAKLNQSLERSSFRDNEITLCHHLIFDPRSNVLMFICVVVRRCLFFVETLNEQNNNVNNVIFCVLLLS